MNTMRIDDHFVALITFLLCFLYHDHLIVPLLLTLFADIMIMFAFLM